MQTNPCLTKPRTSSCSPLGRCSSSGKCPCPQGLLIWTMRTCARSATRMWCRQNSFPAATFPATLASSDSSSRPTSASFAKPRSRASKTSCLKRSLRFLSRLSIGCTTSFLRFQKSNQKIKISFSSILLHDCSLYSYRLMIYIYIYIGCFSQPATRPSRRSRSLACSWGRLSRVHVAAAARILWSWTR